MKRLKYILPLLPLAACANQLPTGNHNPTYFPSNVQTQLRLNIKEDTGTVHFIRDNNDPKIITKTYVLKHADPYSIRPYLREIVQAHRVDYNNAEGRENPNYYNVYSKTNAAKEKMFVQTGVECIKFSDGTGILIVSAEDYRFRDHTNGVGIDTLIDKLDQPKIMNSSGQPKYIYFPSNRPASELLPMIKLVGANVSNDTVELIGGKDKIELDEDLNCLFFNTALYSRQNIEAMLKVYDVVHPEIKIKCTVYELDAENDGMLGLDFQSWKNNEGYKLFSTGADFSRNYNIRDIVAPIRPDGTVNYNYFNFEPRWNTKFLDFLVSKSKAKIINSGELAVRNGNTGKIKRTTGTMYAHLEQIASKPGEGEHGNSVDIKPDNNAFKFELEITPSITAKAAVLELKVSTISMLGYTSAGAIRSSKYETSQKVMLGTGLNRLYLGGIEKTQVVNDVSGVPILKDLPLIGFLFSTERESTKKSRVVVVAECEFTGPDAPINEADMKEIEEIGKITSRDAKYNKYGFRQYLLDDERSKSILDTKSPNNEKGEINHEEK